MLELVELAQPSRNQKELAEQESRLRQGEFTLSDLKRIIDRMRAVRGVGGAAKTLEEMNPEADFRKVTGIIDSMTPEERRNPSNTVNLSRRQRIAVGAGVEPHEVSELVRHFQGLSEMMKKLASMRY